jgi:hypothetical protein
MFWIGLGVGLLFGVLAGVFSRGLGKMAKDDLLNEKGEYVCNYDSNQPDGVFKPEKEG